VTAILSSDILIADVIVELKDNLQLAALIKKYGLKPGGKRAIDAQQFNEFSAAVAGQPITLTPGGSSANMLTTLNRLFDNALDIKLIGVAGEGFSSRMIRTSLESAGISLLPADLPPSPVPKTAMSYVILFPDGQRTIATYPGNAREILQPEMITDALVVATDIVLLQGSLWGKMGDAYADRLVALTLKYKKELWLALPTHSMVGDNHVEQFKKVIPEATLVMGNEEELGRVYNVRVADALKKLQHTFARNTHHIGFITLGEKGAAIVTHDDVTYVPLYEAKSPQIVNTLGAGDTAFAGFAYGYLKKIPNLTSAQIAMVLASAKLGVNGSRLPDPKQILQATLTKATDAF
jgi:sugar/nucleoside kinase (ribokinase family)